MHATPTSKSQITPPKEARDRGLDPGALLERRVVPDNTLTARVVTADARSVRGVLKSPHAAPLTVAQMDDKVAAYLRDKHNVLR